jgi:hypothetical protein
MASGEDKFEDIPSGDDSDSSEVESTTTPEKLNKLKKVVKESSKEDNKKSKKQNKKKERKKEEKR